VHVTALQYITLSQTGQQHVINFIT